MSWVLASWGLSRSFLPVNVGLQATAISKWNPWLSDPCHDTPLSSIAHSSLLLYWCGWKQSVGFLIISKKLQRDEIELSHLSFITSKAFVPSCFPNHSLTIAARQDLWYYIDPQTLATPHTLVFGAVKLEACEWVCEVSWRPTFMHLRSCKGSSRRNNPSHLILNLCMCMVNSWCSDAVAYARDNSQVRGLSLFQLAIIFTIRHNHHHQKISL